ncbi:omega-crystallin-like [Contarinia nasturtii]|uniref:omega-crystallin-like n=1 Tax=Contarinia nasturtii TaxID=265458 RepID=UPI0012D48B36|nr:omega-crystallin-like [Contarinia nasturtii]
MAFKYNEKDIKFTRHFIDGEFRDSKSGKYYELYDLLNNKTLVKVTEGDRDDVELAVNAAVHAFEYGTQWRKMEYAERGRFLYKLADLLERDIDYLVWLEIINSGKTLEDTKFDLRRSIDFLRYYSGYTDKLWSRIDRDKDDYFEFSSKEPVGVIGLISDHIDPLWTFIRQIAPVLTAGNTVVYKPSYKTPLTSLYIAQLTNEVGFPKGVINIVLGKGSVVGEALGLNEYIKHITFTGRREIGKFFYEYARSNFKTLKFYFTEPSPLFVLEDTDIDDAALIAHHAAFFKDGKTRYRPVRIFVHDDIYNNFVKRSVELAQKRKLGDILDKDVRVGSFINEKYHKNFLDYVDHAKKDGAKLEYGGKRYGTSGWIVEPTIFSDVKDEYQFLTDYDVYGPIELITRFKKFEDIPDFLRKLHYDHTIGIISRNFNRFKELVRHLNINLFWFNTWHDFKPYLKYQERKQQDFGGYFDEEYFDRDVIEYYLKKKTIDGLWETRKYDTYIW